MKIRKVRPDDVGRICEIYNYYIENTAITFETAPVSETKMKERISEVLDSGLPYYVGEIEGYVVGYCYIHTWNNRCAYSATKEVTVYLDKAQTGRGFGSMFYNHLLQSIDKEDIHVLIAGICIPNEGSVKLHEKFGFKQISHMKEVGWKFDRWRDVGHWQLIFDK